MRNKGFTLIELLVVLVIIGIFAAFAVPNYQKYVRRSIASQAEHEMQRISTLLEKHRSRNFNYRGFSISPTPIVIPVNTVGAKIQYTIVVRDAANPSVTLTDASAMGQGWVILAMANSKINNGSSCTTCNFIQDQNYNFLMTSSGIRCKTKDKLVEQDALTSANLLTAQPCGASSESW